MLEDMGRENMKDFNAEFLVMLESWEAGASFAGGLRQNVEAIDPAKRLGWTRVDPTAARYLPVRRTRQAIRLVTLAITRPPCL
jgi:hypothetical protein